MARLLDRIQGNREVHEALFDAVRRGRLASTLLFAGPSGIGKKLFALSLAQTLVCESGEVPACGKCGACLRVANGQSESLLVIEPDGAGIKIEQVRDVLQFISLQKLGRARVIVIDEAHLLNQQSANALLKSLEEPPPETYFVLSTPLEAAVLATIRSRSQLVRFRALSNEEVAVILGEKADPWVLEASQGSVESALRLLEAQDEFRELDEAVLSFVTAALRRFPVDEAGRMKDLTKDKSAQAFATSAILGGLRNALRLQAGVEPRASSPGWLEFARSAASFSPRDLEAVIAFSLNLGPEMSRNIDRGLLFENFALELTKAAPR